MNEPLLLALCKTLTFFPVQKIFMLLKNRPRLQYIVLKRIKGILKKRVKYQIITKNFDTLPLKDWISGKYCLERIESAAEAYRLVKISGKKGLFLHSVGEFKLSDSQILNFPVKIVKMGVLTHFPLINTCRIAVGSVDCLNIASCLSEATYPNYIKRLEKTQILKISTSNLNYSFLTKLVNLRELSIEMCTLPRMNANLAYLVRLNYSASNQEECFFTGSSLVYLSLRFVCLTPSWLKMVSSQKRLKCLTLNEVYFEAETLNFTFLPFGIREMSLNIGYKPEFGSFLPEILKTSSNILNMLKSLKQLKALFISGITDIDSLMRIISETNIQKLKIETDFTATNFSKSYVETASLKELWLSGTNSYFFLAKYPKIVLNLTRLTLFLSVLKDIQGQLSLSHFNSMEVEELKSKEETAFLKEFVKQTKITPQQVILMKFNWFEEDLLTHLEKVVEIRINQGKYTKTEINALFNSTTAQKVNFPLLPYSFRRQCCKNKLIYYCNQ